MLSFQSLAPHAGVRRLQGPSRCQAPGVTRLTARARKQTEKQDVEADLADTTLPADLQKLSKLAKAELQQHLESRGLDKDGNKEELANRLLDNMIAQESALSTNPPDRVMLQQQLDQSTNTARRGRRTSRKATASADPQPELPSAAQASDPVVAAAAASAAVAEQVVDAPAASSRRGRKTSRKATSSTDPLPSPADIVAAAETAAKPSSTTGRGRKTSRKATSSADPLPSAAEAMMAAARAAPAAAGSEETTDVKGTRRGRKTSRKATTSAEPTQDPVAAAAEAATAAAAVVEASSPAADVGSSTIRRARRSKSTAADPIPTAAEDATAAKAGRGRKTSRKSSVVEPVEASAVSAPTFDEPAAAPTTRQRGRASSAKTASKAPTAAADQPAAASSPPLSRAKLLAQQLAQKEKATHGAGAAAAAAASAAASASAPAAAPGSSWVTSDELLYAGSQAQPDSLLLGADSTFSVDNGSVDEVMAQLTAERAAGLADEPALRPEAVLSPLTNSSSSSGVLQQPQEVTQPALADIAAAADAAPQQYMQSFVEATATDGTATADDGALSAFDHMMLPPSAGAADAAASAVVNTEQKQTEEDLQHPSMADCVAAVEEPLKASAEAVVLDEAPDAAMAAFDHDTSLDTPAAAAAAEGNQVPSLLDIADLAAESAQEGSPLGPSLEESVGEDEEPDVALAAFDHMAVPEAAAAAPAAPAAAFTNSSSSSKTEAAAASDGGYDQAYLDPLQPSATVGSGSVDLADAEAAAVVVPAPSAAAAKPAAAAASASAAVQPQQQPKGSSSAGAGSADLSVLVQRWWESVVQMFEDWQKNLSGPK